MVITKNIAKNEKLIRIISGVILIPLGFFMTGFWKPLSIAIGAWLIVTAFVGY